MNSRTLLTLATALGALALSSNLQAQTVIRLRGSDTLGAKLLPQLAEGFKKQGGVASFDIAAEGSSTAFSNLAAGTAEIGMSSRKVKPEEETLCKTKSVFLEETEISWDMLTIIVNKSNPVTNLSKKQVQQIFTGDIKDWSEVGGTPGPISLYTRNTSSGTYKDFMGLAMKGKDYAAESQKMAGNEQIAQEVGTNKSGIGYVGLAYIKADGVKPTTIDDMPAVEANAKVYPYSRPNYLYTNGKPTGVVKSFIDFCLSAEGEKIVEGVGFVPKSKAK